MIITFSGSGNSLLVARGLQTRLFPEGDPAANLVILEGETLLHPERQLLRADEKEQVIWVFPIYCWGVPPIVLRFIDKVRFKGAETAIHQMVCTCGDDMGRADDQWRQHIGRRGWTPRAVYSVIMPNTYVCMKGFDVDPAELRDSKLAAVPARLDDIVASIRRGFGGDDLTRGSMAWLKTNIEGIWFRAFKMSPLPFSADPEKCTSCGLCSRNCPLENITMKDGHPQWGPLCAMCLRCYHRCPVHAISYGHTTDNKGQYRAPSTL